MNKCAHKHRRKTNKTFFLKKYKQYLILLLSISSFVFHTCKEVGCFIYLEPETFELSSICVIFLKIVLSHKILFFCWTFEFRCPQWESITPNLGFKTPCRFQKYMENIVWQCVAAFIIKQYLLFPFYPL